MSRCLARAASIGLALVTGAACIDGKSPTWRHALERSELSTAEFTHIAAEAAREILPHATVEETAPLSSSAIQAALWSRQFLRGTHCWSDAATTPWRWNN